MSETASTPTLICCDRFRIVEGRIHVQKRSWEMIRNFADHMARPVFAMHEDPAEKTLTFPLPPGVEVIRLPSDSPSQRITGPLLNRPWVPAIENLLADNCLVYLRMPHWTCCRIFQRARAHNNRIMASFHGNWAEGYRNKPGSGLSRITAQLLARHTDRWYRTIARHSEILFCTGQRLQETYGDLAPRNVVIANFLHGSGDICQDITPRALKSPCHILFVGSLEERKGLIHLLNSIAMLSRESVETRLTIIGTGPLRQSLVDKAAGLGIGERVTFVDYIQYGQELYDRFRAADLFVLPSISSEGVPKVLVESMSQGVPVIATDIGSSRDLLDNGRRGLVIPPGDENALCQAIRTLISDDSLRQSLIEQGIEFAKASTRDVQRAKIRQALEETVPDILGVPAWMDPGLSPRPAQLVD